MDPNEPTKEVNILYTYYTSWQNLFGTDSLAALDLKPMSFQSIEADSISVHPQNGLVSFLNLVLHIE